MSPSYTVQRATSRPSISGNWEEPSWQEAETLEITHYLKGVIDGKEASVHQPKTEARVLYDDAGLYIHFRVEDKYVRCVETKYHGRVWEDSAVEFFVAPKAGRGYFNVEINCGGAMLLSYHEDPGYTGPPLREGGSVPWELAEQVTIFHSMPSTVEPEIAEATTWHIEYFIPFDLFETYLGPLGDVAGQEWKANFYKIAETNSHPHFGAWSPILEGKTFHAPPFFGTLRFAP